jgi:hypothetical protein
MVRRAGVRPLSTVDEGAQAILNLATSPAVEGQIGLYFNGYMRQKRRPKPMIQMRVGGEQPLQCGAIHRPAA